MRIFPSSLTFAEPFGADCTPPAKNDAAASLAAPVVSVPGACTHYCRVSFRGSEKMVSGTAALRAISLRARGLLTRSDSLIPSRTARLITQYAIQMVSKVIPTSSTTQMIPSVASALNSCSCVCIDAPSLSGDSAIPGKLRSLSRRHVNAQQWREIAEFFEPEYVARLRAIGRWDGVQ